VCLCASACPVCPVCVPAPPGVFLPVLSSVWSVCLFVRPRVPPRVPSVCPVRVSRLPPVSLYRYCTGCVSLCPGLPTVSYRVRVRYSAVYFLLMSKTVHRGSRDTHGTVPVHPPVSFTGTVHQPGTGTGNSPISHATRHQSRARRWRTTCIPGYLLRPRDNAHPNIARGSSPARAWTKMRHSASSRGRAA